jgi:hypothetical protein
MANKAQLTYTTTIQWSGGTLFDGYVLLIMALPSASGSDWSKVCLKDSRPRLRVPTRVMVPIRQGVYDTATYVWRTDSILPPLVKYSSFYYDSTDRFIAVGPDLFTITADSHTLTPPTLTDPTAAVVSVTPETVPSAPVTVTIGPTVEDVQGTKNGVNTSFTITRAGTITFILLNGVVQTSGTDYTLTGTALTMTVAPAADDTLKAVIW